MRERLKHLGAMGDSICIDAYVSLSSLLIVGERRALAGHVRAAVDSASLRSWTLWRDVRQ